MSTVCFRFSCWLLSLLCLQVVPGWHTCRLLRHPLHPRRLPRRRPVPLGSRQARGAPPTGGRCSTRSTRAPGSRRCRPTTGARRWSVSTNSPARSPWSRTATSVTSGRQKSTYPSATNFSPIRRVITILSAGPLTSTPEKQHQRNRCLWYLLTKRKWNIMVICHSQNGRLLVSCC